MHTPGNWKLSPRGDAVVTDQPLPGYNTNGGHDSVKYYGGHLIAESIWREEDRELIAAAPELLEALQHVVLWHDQLTPTDIERYKAVIAKATGVQA